MKKYKEISQNLSNNIQKSNKKLEIIEAEFEGQRERKAEIDNKILNTEIKLANLKNDRNRILTRNNKYVNFVTGLLNVLSTVCLMYLAYQISSIPNNIGFKALVGLLSASTAVVADIAIIMQTNKIGNIIKTNIQRKLFNSNINCIELTERINNVQTELKIERKEKQSIVQIINELQEQINIEKENIRINKQSLENLEREMIDLVIEMSSKEQTEIKPYAKTRTIKEEQK